MGRRVSRNWEQDVPDWDRLPALTPMPSGYALSQDDVHLVARLDGGIEDAPVSRISPELLTLVVGSEVRPALGAGVEVLLVAGYRQQGPFPAVVESRVAGERGVELRLRFVDVRRDAGQRFMELLRWLRSHRHAISSQPITASSEVITDPEAIFRHMRALMCHQATGLATGAGNVPWPVGAAGLQMDETLPLRWRLRAPPMVPPFELAIGGYNSVFSWNVRHAETIKGALATAMPETLLRTRHRWRRRVAAPQGLSVAFQHPLWPELELCRTLRDVATQGLGFWTFPDDDLLYPGLYLPHVDLIYQGELVCSGEGLLRHISELPPVMHSAGGDDTIAGVVFRPHGAGDDARWLNLVNRLLNPNTRSGATWSEFSWDVYADSGYFNLSGKTPGHFATLRDSFASVSRSIDASPWIGCQAVWPSPEGIEATFTFIKAYQGSWFGFQLARKPGSAALRAPSRQVLRELYLRVFEHMQHDKEMEWVAGYLEATVSWNQIAQFAYARHHAASGRACLLPMVLMECEISELDDGPDPTHHIEPGDAEDVDALLRHVAQTRPPAYAAALDLTPPRFEMGDLAGAWGSVGFLRERATLVARDPQGVVAMAVLETGQTGVSLFNLLDSLRMFALRPGGESAFGDLLAAARRWFIERQKDTFVVFCEGWERELGHALGLKDLGDGQLWIIARELLPDFLERIHSLLAPKRGDNEP